MIRLRFVAGNDFFSHVIRAGETGFWASHVEAVTPDGRWLGALAQGGVQARPADYDKGQWTQQLFVNVPATDEQAAAFYAFLEAQIGDAYDIGAIEEIAGDVAGSIMATRQPKWICSALQTGALMAAGIIKSAPATVRLTTPRDVLMMCAGLGALIGEPETAPGGMKAVLAAAFPPISKAEIEAGVAAWLSPIQIPAILTEVFTVMTGGDSVDASREHWQTALRDLAIVKAMALGTA